MECRAAFRWAIGAFTLGIVNFVIMWWALSGIADAMNRVSDRLERINASKAH